jgi:hypothetical protein
VLSEYLCQNSWSSPSKVKKSELAFNSSAREESKGSFLKIGCNKQYLNKKGVSKLKKLISILKFKF